MTSYRARWRQVPWYAWIGPVYWMGRVLTADPGVAAVVVCGLIVVLAAAEMAFIRSHVGTDVTPYGVTLRRLRTRTIPWTDVRGVRTRRVLGTHVVELDVGRPKWARLPMPAHTAFVAPDPDFRAKADTIAARWMASRATSAGSAP